MLSITIRTLDAGTSALIACRDKKKHLARTKHLFDR